MTFTISEAVNAPAETAGADFPLIRHFGVKRTAVEQPMSTVEGAWSVCTPASVGNFTAVGFFFARESHRHLGVPIGIIHASWGGTLIESGMSEAALRSDPAFEVVLERRAQSLAGYPPGACRLQCFC